MRILLVNKFIFPKGGAETYTFDVGKMLEEHGHKVQYFGLENEKNTVGNRIGSWPFELYKQKYTIVKRVTIENISADDVESKMRPNENLKNIF